MTDVETALEQWREYFARFPQHDSIIRSIQRMWGGLDIDEVLHDHLADHCIAWAHRELVRRGWIVKALEWPKNMEHKHNLGWLCRVDISTPEDGHDTIFQAPTLLDCYLQAIKATEKK